MADSDRVFGTEVSVQLIAAAFHQGRAHFHCKAIPHQWLLRNARSERDTRYAAPPERAALALIPDAAACLAGLPA
jgi:hypothetical protein